MEREYSTGTHGNDPDFFVGREVEHTSAYGLKTLFCHGCLDIKDILDKIYEMGNRDGFPDHVYLNHNHTVLLDGIEKIKTLIFHGFYVTYEAQCVDDLLDYQDGWLTHLLSVKIPRANRVGLAIKIDDLDFNATNPGVWTVYPEQLKDHFTPWSAYEGDEIL